MWYGCFRVGCILLLLLFWNAWPQIVKIDCYRDSKWIFRDLFVPLVRKYPTEAPIFSLLLCECWMIFYCSATYFWDIFIVRLLLQSNISIRGCQKNFLLEKNTTVTTDEGETTLVFHRRWCLRSKQQFVFILASLDRERKERVGSFFRYSYSLATFAVVW